MTTVLLLLLMMMMTVIVVSNKKMKAIDHDTINLPEFFQVTPEDIANRDLRL